uniref:INO80 complex subunit B n=1 Tax=Hippocampus comes TaxID=109280 RepID=A0A3Q3DY55_HIPCM
SSAPKNTVAFSLAGEGGLGPHGMHKHKHKKHKRHKRKHHGLPAVPEPVVAPRPPPQLRLKIKLGGQTLGTKRTVFLNSVKNFLAMGVLFFFFFFFFCACRNVCAHMSLSVSDEDSNMATSPLADMDSDSMLGVPVDEEERWLDALEKGELDDNGELKKEVDESLLTARQKALLHKQQIQPLLELPMGYKEKEMTAEMMQKREERARKRRLQAAKKAEENKNQTIERLTKTSKAKMKSTREKKSKQSQCPMVRYSDSARGVTVSFPAGVPAAPGAPPPAAPVGCGVSGCSNPKKYSCSKTGVPLCSLQCYQRNLRLARRTGSRSPDTDNRITSL